MTPPSHRSQKHKLVSGQQKCNISLIFRIGLCASSGSVDESGNVPGREQQESDCPAMIPTDRSLNLRLLRYLAWLRDARRKNWRMRTT
jgi:hypothetical protein